MQDKSLPPLDLLKPFEAAARHCSFTLAADELAVTQSAISQRVRKLEDLLGTKLFARHHRAIELTPEGRELLNGVSVALRHLASAAEGIRQQGGRARVRLGVDTSIARLWLPRRLKRILADNPAFDIDLTVSDVEADILSADLCILHGGGHWPGYSTRVLFQDQIFPVCSPTYLEQHPVTSAQDLLSADLIDLDYMHWNWINWRIWFTEAKLAQPQARTVLRTNSYTALLDAARAGLGVALGWAQLLEDDLQSGALIRPVEQSVGTDFGYYLLVRDGADDTVRNIADALAPE